MSINKNLYDNNMSITDKLFALMAWKLNGMSEAAAYDSWSDAQCKSHLKEHFNQGHRKRDQWIFTQEDLQRVSMENLFYLGFRSWNGSDELLMPLWIYPNMAKEETWYIIDGEETSLGVFDDMDTRFGCLAIFFKYNEEEPLIAEPGESVEEVDNIVHPFRDDEFQ